MINQTCFIPPTGVPVDAITHSAWPPPVGASKVLPRGHDGGLAVAIPLEPGTKAAPPATAIPPPTNATAANKRLPLGPLWLGRMYRGLPKGLYHQVTLVRQLLEVEMNFYGV